MRLRSLIVILPVLIPISDAVRIAGPIVTITLRDPYFITTSKTPASIVNASPNDVSAIEKIKPSAQSAFSSLSLSSLNPDVAYSIRSNDGGPFPKLLPSLKMLSATAYYKYNVMRKLPHAISFYGGFRIRPFQLLSRLPRMTRSSIESFESKATQQEALIQSSNIPDLNEYADDRALNLSFSPTFNLNSKTVSGELKVWGEDIKRWSGTARLNLPYPSSETKIKQLLSFACVTCKLLLPFNALSSLTVTPSYNTAPSLYPFRVQVTAESGAGKTSAVLSLNLDDPSLTLIHQLDERNTIAPEISLHTAKILYNWTTQLSSGMLRTRVDPTNAIQVTWVDRAGSGRWVTDFKLPLDGTAGPLAADIRVQRQFEF